MNERTSSKIKNDVSCILVGRVIQSADHRWSIHKEPEIFHIVIGRGPSSRFLRQSDQRVEFLVAFNLSVLSRGCQFICIRHPPSIH